MVEVDIHIKDNQHRFTIGDIVSGAADVTLPEDVPVSAVSLSFHCLGEVKWVEYPGTPYYLNGYVYYDQYDYHEEVQAYNEKAISVTPHMDHKKATIPFSFVIPKDKSLPSTMISNHGFIQYFVRATIKLPKDEVKKFIKEIIVQAPMEENLMITVGGTVEKSVLLHGGKVSMHATIGRKGFAPGESITVHVAVDNKSNTKLVPRVSLHQVQIYMCGARHKTIETTMSEEPVVGAEIAPHSQVEEVLNVLIPSDESLSIKSTVITVKYFVHVTLDIPHSFDLHINLPVVLTSQKVIEAAKEKKDQPEVEEEEECTTRIQGRHSPRPQYTQRHPF